MKKEINIAFIFISFILFLSISNNAAISKEPDKNKILDEKVEKFLESHKDQWVDWNVSEVDGKV